MEKYLENNLIEFILDGLKETVTKEPEDPVDLLVFYLIRLNIFIKEVQMLNVLILNFFKSDFKF